MYYRIIKVPPGYVHPQNFMVAEYPTIELPSSACETMRDAAGSIRFFKTVEDARKLLPDDAIQLPFVPEHQFLELWTTTESGA